MRVVIQRVSSASVMIDERIHSNIARGMLVFIGIESHDTEEDIEWLISKITNLRIYNDSDDKMNLSPKDIGAEYLVVSQFTLHASTKKGNRPSYIKAARPDFATPMYELFVKRLADISETDVKTGIFGADMKVSLVNDGPVTIWIDSKNKE